MGDYILIIILQILGIGFSVGQKCIELDKKDPDDGFIDVLILFWKRDKITLIISGLGLVGNVVLHYILNNYENTIVEMENYPLYAFGFALVLGYGGQRLIYSLLGKGVKMVDNNNGNA